MNYSFNKYLQRIPWYEFCRFITNECQRMNKTIYVFVLFLLHLSLAAQTDTLVTHTNKISCTVIKIQTDSIKYRLVNSKELLHISKKEVDKIIYKNGKSFSIKEDIRLKHIEGVSNFNDVVTSFTPDDTLHTIKISELQVPFNYELSGQKKYLEKRYAQLRIQAAMQGANLIYIPNQKALLTEGSTDSTMTQLLGIGYSSEKLSADTLEKIIGDKNNFTATHQWYLQEGKSDVYQLYFNGVLIIDEIIETDEKVTITGELKGFPKVSAFRLISISEKFFTINFIMNGTLYNVQVDL